MRAVPRVFPLCNGGARRQSTDGASIHGHGRECKLSAATQTNSAVLAAAWCSTTFMATLMEDAKGLTMDAPETPEAAKAKKRAEIMAKLEHARAVKAATEHDPKLDLAKLVSAAALL